MPDATDMFEPLPPATLLNGSIANLGLGTVSAEWEPVLPVPDDAPRIVPCHRLGEPSAVWDYRDAYGQLLGRVCRWDHDAGKTILPLAYGEDPEGRGTWRWAHLPAPRPLYGLDRLAKRPDHAVLVIEGEKAADAAAKLFPEHVAVTSSGGANAAGRSAWSPLAGRNVLIWPDQDNPGRQYAADVARLVADAGGASVRLVAVPGDWPQGWDLADALPAGVTLEDVRVMLGTAPEYTCREGSAGFTGSAHAKPKVTLAKTALVGDGSGGFQEGSAGFQDAASEQKDWLPSGFRRRADGAILYEAEPDIFEVLCSPLDVEAATRSSEGADWGRLLRVKDRDGCWHEWAMPMAELAGSGEGYRARLLAMGLELAPGTRARNALHRLLTAANPQGRARCVSTLGWHDSRYLLPDEVIGEVGRERLVLQTTGPLSHNLRMGGSLEGWQEDIGRLAVGNSRLVFAVSMAFAAPMLRALGMEGGGVHFRGSSSIGKTTIGEVAGSVCGGGPSGYKLTWRATDNAIEAVAAAHNDGFAVLDEIGQVSAEALGPIAYMLANGQAKRRMSRDAVARVVPTWRLLFLSTGEMSLADKMAEGRRGARVMAGQQVRVLDLPAGAGAGHGVFDTLHGFVSGQALADHLKASVHTHYGHPLRAFLRRLVEEQPGARAFIDGFVSDVVPVGADGQVCRAAQRFGVIGAAGELGARWGIVPWPEGEAMEAASRLFREWVVARGGHEPAEFEAGIGAVRRFLETHGSSRFAPWEDPGRPVSQRAGFVHLGDGGPTYFVLPEAWRGDVLVGHDPGLIAKELVRRGMLKSTADGKPQTKQRLPDGTERRVYVILPSFLTGGER